MPTLQGYLPPKKKIIFPYPVPASLKNSHTHAILINQLCLCVYTVEGVTLNIERNIMCQTPHSLHCCQELKAKLSSHGKEYGHKELPFLYNAYSEGMLSKLL